MKKMTGVVIVLGFAIFLAFCCGKKEQTEQAPATLVDTSQTVQPAAAVYYCPMDPEIVSDKPGKCSKCGMDLIEKPAETK